MSNIKNEQENKKPPHFDISASVVKQLGEELVTDEVTALMELVKNSYDADAGWVKIDIHTKSIYDAPIKFFKDNKIGYVSIEDNGFGMSDDDIINGWLVISLSGKRKMKKEGLTTPQGRTPLGDKGLGRLSTQRLGDRLEMLTVKDGTKDINHIAFDWSTFTEDVSLTNVGVHVDRIADDKAKKGTKLIITNLANPKIWEGEAADKIKGQLSQLIFPYKTNRKFRVLLSINGQQVDFDELNEDLREQAASRFVIDYTGTELKIKGKIKQQKLLGNKTDDRVYYDRIVAADFGKNFYTFLTDARSNKRHYLSNVKYVGTGGWFFDFEITKTLEDIGNKAVIYDEANDQELYADPGQFHGEIDDYDLRGSDTVESIFDSLGQFKNIVKNQVGIRIFRDGFGIKPFGINGEDWLNLSGGQTSGSSFYGLRPGNVVGFVAISAKENEQLKEKTDREGFVDSPYSKNFFNLMSNAIDEINTVIEKTKRSYNDFKKAEAEKNLGIHSIKDVTNNLKKTASSARKMEEQSKKIEVRLLNAINGITEIKQKPASKEDKKLIVQIEDLLNDSRLLLNNVTHIITDAKRLDEVSNYLTPRIEELETQLDEFAELAGLGLTAEALSHEMSNIVDRLVDQTNILNKDLKKSKNVNPTILIYVEYVNSIIKSFRKQLSHLAPLLKYARETKEVIALDKFAKELKSFYQDRFGELIDFNLDLDKQAFEIKVSKGKLTQIFDNLVLNSEYWLRERLKTDKSLGAKITFQIRKPFVRIFDNGIGIDPNLDNRIFQPFVTGKPKDVGRGLGLFIVQQLLDSIGCDITLLQDKNQHNRKYIFQINLDSLTN